MLATDTKFREKLADTLEEKWGWNFGKLDRKLDEVLEIVKANARGIDTLKHNHEIYGKKLDGFESKLKGIERKLERGR